MVDNSLLPFERDTYPLSEGLSIRATPCVARQLPLASPRRAWARSGLPCPLFRQLRPALAPEAAPVGHEPSTAAWSGRRPSLEAGGASAAVDACRPVRSVQPV